jgi:hypothetical protein
MPYINPTVRAIYIDEYDYEIIAALIEAKITKLKASSEQCSRGYGSASSKDKAERLTAEAHHLRTLLSQLTTEIV